VPYVLCCSLELKKKDKKSNADSSTALGIDLSTAPIVLLLILLLTLLLLLLLSLLLALLLTLLLTPAAYRVNLEEKKKNNNKIKAIKLTLFFFLFSSL